jgi:formamidopyrimidine-DNA glycosylase
VPEIPDIEAYLVALRSRLLDCELVGVRVSAPFFLRTTDPLPDSLVGRRVASVCRLGKRIVMGFDGELFAVIHLMVAGRLHWRPPGAALARGRALAAFDFPCGTLVVTEAGKKRRASLHLVRGKDALALFDPGGLEVQNAPFEEFAEALARENHTLKRALTDPHILSGIGNAYSDEILHRARLSPLKQTGSLTEEETRRLYDAARTALTEWTDRLAAGARETFPEGVTAFRPEMSVHGKFKEACPVCGTAVQRIVYAENECDYCPRCQTEGRLLADRALSRLLKGDWPRTVEDLESRRRS